MGSPSTNSSAETTIAKEMKLQSLSLTILFIAAVAWAAEFNDHDHDDIVPEDHEVPEEAKFAAQKKPRLKKTQARAEAATCSPEEGSVIHAQLNHAEHVPTVEDMKEVVSGRCAECVHKMNEIGKQDRVYRCYVEEKTKCSAEEGSVIQTQLNHAEHVLTVEDMKEVVSGRCAECVHEMIEIGKHDRVYECFAAQKKPRIPRQIDSLPPLSQ